MRQAQIFVGEQTNKQGETCFFIYTGFLSFCDRESSSKNYGEFFAIFFSDSEGRSVQALDINRHVDAGFLSEIVSLDYQVSARKYGLFVGGMALSVSVICQ